MTKRKGSKNAWPTKRWGWMLNRSKAYLAGAHQGWSRPLLHATQLELFAAAAGTRMVSSDPARKVHCGTRPL